MRLTPALTLILSAMLLCGCTRPTADQPQFPVEGVTLPPGVREISAEHAPRIVPASSIPPMDENTVDVSIHDLAVDIPPSELVSHFDRQLKARGFREGQHCDSTRHWVSDDGKTLVWLSGWVIYLDSPGPEDTPPEQAGDVDPARTARIQFRLVE